MPIFNILHLFGVALGAGGAFVGDALFLSAARNGILSKDEVRLLNIAGKVAWLGLALLLFSGFMMFLSRPDELLASSKFIAKMVIVGVILVNGIALHAYHTPILRRHIGIPFATSPEFRKKSRFMLLSGSVSVISWSFAIILGGLRSLPFTPEVIILGYFVVLLAGVGVTQLMRPFVLGIK